jgi:hypothetical protein
MGESSQQKYSRIQRDIQSAILENYPNPDRNGCPGRPVVEGFARNPEQITADDDVNPESNWYHITHCSPCYAEFLELRTAFRKQRIQQRSTRRAIIRTALVVIAGGVGWFVVDRDRPRSVEIDFEKYISTRGPADTGSQGPLTLPSGRLHIRLRLPKDSAKGLYSVQLSKEPGVAPFFSTTASTVSEGSSQVLVFDAKIAASPGNYTLAVRGDHRGVWRYCTFVLETR